MPPVDLFKDSAINANKASAVTPQTMSPQPAAASLASSTASTTSHAAPLYPAARAGAAAVPAPTGAAQRYAPTAIQPTPTATSGPFPPAPQPGAVPFPSSTSIRPQSSIPPPPKAGEAIIPPSRTEAAPSSQNYPRQMYMPSPANVDRAQPPISSTSTTTAPLSSYPVSLPTSHYEDGRQSLDGPSGYRQNPYASDLAPDQRRAQDGLGGDSESGGTTGMNVWDTAKQWAQKAGEKISEAESEVWKKVNK